MSDWISVKHKMPGIHDHVLIYIPNIENCFEYAVGYLENDKNFYFSETEDNIDCVADYQVTHWRELPEKPKLKEKALQKE